MSSQNSEFIIIKSELEIKGENDIKKESMVEEYLEIRDTVADDEEAKCGEIFVSNSGTFILICVNCKDSFENMRSFGEHIRTKHLNADYSVSCFDSRDSDNLWLSHKTEFTTDPFKDIQTFALHTRTTNKHLNDDGLDPVFESGSDNMNSNAASKRRNKKCLAGRAKSASTDRKWSCEICNLQYKLKSSLKRHNKRHKIEVPVLLESKEEQIENEIPEATVVSENLNASSKPPISLQSHDGIENTNARKDSTVSAESCIELDFVEDPRFFCEICNRQYKSKQKLQWHAIRHETAPIAMQRDPNYLKCRKCNLEFVDYPEWVKHKKTHKRVHSYPCPHCKKTFTHRLSREMHINSHTGEKPFKCPQCPIAFAHSSNLAWHVKRIHLKLKSYACEVCDKRFTCNVEKNIHMRQHTGEKPYQCESCGKDFMISGQLNEHRKQHKIIKDVTCPICGKDFYSTKLMRGHMVKHSTERPHVCPVCGNAFTRRRAMLTHQKLHMDVKQYVCTICGKAFAQSAGLYSHKKSHGIIAQGANK